MRLAPLICLTLVCTVASTAEFDVARTEAGWEYSVDGRPAFVYHVDTDVMKHFLHPLLTPSGHAVTVSRHSQWHHHGLWLTWGPVRIEETGEKVDFWSEGGNPATKGRIVVRNRSQVKAEADRFVSRNRWQRASDGLVLLTERREIRPLDSGTKRAHLLTVDSRQKARRDVTLLQECNETVAYYGLCLQMPSDMSHGLVLNSHGDTGRAGIEGLGARWCAYYTNVAPARGVAIFDHPDNPRHPNAWFTLESGFLATSVVAHEDYALEAGDRLRLRYGVLAFEGPLNRRLIDRAYRHWVRSTAD